MNPISIYTNPVAVLGEILSEIPVKMTRVVFGHTVTRWSANAFEIDTWGRAYYDIDKAAEMLAK